MRLYFFQDFLPEHFFLRALWVSSLLASTRILSHNTSSEHMLAAHYLCLLLRPKRVIGYTHVSLRCFKYLLVGRHI